MVHARHLGKERVVPTGHLSAALNHVTGYDPPGQCVPVVAAPVVVPRGGSAHQRRVGHASGDDDVGSSTQRFHDAEAAEVGVSGDEAGEVTHGLASFKVREVNSGGAQLVEAPQKIVAVNVGHSRRQSQPSGHLGDGLRTVIGVQPSGVRDHFDAPLEAGPHDLFHLVDETAGVPGARIFRARARQDQHGQFGEPVSRQDVNGTTLDHLHRGRESVTVETGTVGNA